MTVVKVVLLCPPVMVVKVVQGGFTSSTSDGGESGFTLSASDGGESGRGWSYLECQ